MTLSSGARRLPHLAYLEALASSEEDSSRWHALTAGYAVLQLFDAWADVDYVAVPPTSLELRRVRKRLATVEAGDPIRRCLTQLVDVIEQPLVAHSIDERRLRGYQVGRVLAAYAKLLQYESSWSLSRDVHETLITYTRFVGDEERLLDSMLQVGFCLRMLGQFDEAREAYEALQAMAREAGSEQYLLLAELGFAKIAIERGNLPAAAGMLDRILEDTRGGTQDVVRVKAMMDRARIANQLGDLASAAVLGHEAFQCSADPMERDRILINLGTTLTLMGLWDEARDAYLVVTATAQEAAVRWMAQINLMELAYLDRNEVLFEQYNRLVPLNALPPYVEAVYHDTRAHGLCMFGRFAEASLAFHRMLELAERHTLNEFVLRASRALEDVTKVGSALEKSARRHLEEQPAEIAMVAGSLSRIREHAGI